MSEESVGRRNRVGWWVLAVGVQIAAATAAMIAPSAFGYGGKLVVFDDVKIYHRYALPILEGQVPYRDFSVEYPILAVPFFVAPLVAGASFETYKYAFAAIMLATSAAATWLVARQVEESAEGGQVPARLAWYTTCFVASCPMIIARFDLVPMLLAFAAARQLSKGRAAVGGLSAGLGVLVKMVPGLVLLPWIAFRGPSRPKVEALATFALTIALGGLGWWCLGGPRVLDSFRYHGERGLEIGSTYASAYLLAHRLAGTLIFTHFDHGSMNISGPGSHDAAKLAPILQAAFLLLVAGRAREAIPGQPFRWASAALLAYVLTSKVLSPQYLIWLIPFVSVLEGRTGVLARRLFLACVLLTTASYPHLYHALSYFELGPVVVLAARNLGLAWLFAILLGGRPGANPEDQIG